MCFVLWLMWINHTITVSPVLFYLRDLYSQIPHWHHNPNEFISYEINKTHSSYFTWYITSSSGMVVCWSATAQLSFAAFLLVTFTTWASNHAPIFISRASTKSWIYIKQSIQLTKMHLSKLKLPWMNKRKSQPAVQNYFTYVSVVFLTDLVFSLSDYEQDDSESLL